MNINDLLKKVTQLNKINNELGIDMKINLLIEERFSKPIRIYKNSDLKEIKEIYIEELVNKILNNDLVKVDKYTYIITDTEFNVFLEFN